MATETSLTPLFDESNGCCEGFGQLCQILERGTSPVQERLNLPTINDEFGRFRVWSGNIGALQKGAVSLDYRLSESSMVRGEVLKLLRDLKYSLDESEYTFKLDFILSYLLLNT
jgi:hypothetical protein